MSSFKHWVIRLAAAAGVGTAAMAIAADPPSSYSSQDPNADWFAPGVARVLAAGAEFPDASGKVGIVNAAGPVVTRGHPFFEPLGSNGRACVTCHQPTNGMSLSVDTIRQRWKETDGKDPLFAAIDGSNCPDLPQDDPKSHSLLLDRGLFRISLPWPPKTPDGTRFSPDFTIEVVSDPTGCNSSSVYGLNSAEPRISVFRRPRVVANEKFIVAPRNLFNTKTGLPVVVNPDTGQLSSMQLMSDSRQPGLKTQAIEAAFQHEQASGPPSAAQLQQIADFETQIFAAQSYDRQAGDLTAADAPPALGPKRLAATKAIALGDNLDNPVFGKWDAWTPAPGAHTQDASDAFRASVARGQAVFFLRPFWIRDAVHLNTVGLGNPIKRTCSTCHNMTMLGMDVAPGWMDIGVDNEPWADPRPELPTFKISCKPHARPHPYLGREILTHDPGRALITGRCYDVGSVTEQQMRALSARAPYFSSGAARTLDDVVEFYNRRFEMNLTPDEKRDLVNFLSVL
jgi:hypothetical protein